MAQDYTVSQGDCISSIAYENGFFWQTVWNHPKNANLKETRKDPNVLKEGDAVYVPDLTLKGESGATEQKHKFKLKGVPAKFRLQLLKPPKPPKPGPKPKAAPVDALHLVDEDAPSPAPAPDEPWANAPYRLEIDGLVKTGQSDDKGVVKIAIPPNASGGKLVVQPGSPDETVLDLALGCLAPLDSPMGAKQRLFNLGYDCGDAEDSDSPAFSAALSAFQENNKLECTGELDDQTRNKLKEIHGS